MDNTPSEFRGIFRNLFFQPVIKGQEVLHIAKIGYKKYAILYCTNLITDPVTISSHSWKNLFVGQVDEDFWIPKMSEQKLDFSGPDILLDDGRPIIRDGIEVGMQYEFYSGGFYVASVFNNPKQGSGRQYYKKNSISKALSSYKCVINPV